MTSQIRVLKPLERKCCFLCGPLVDNLFRETFCAFAKFQNRYCLIEPKNETKRVKKFLKELLPFELYHFLGLAAFTMHFYFVIFSG